MYIAHLSGIFLFDDSENPTPLTLVKNEIIAASEYKRRKKSHF